MRIFLTNLGKYNEGELLGQWLKLPCSDSQLKATLKAIGIGEEYEETFITDYENDYGFEINEYDSLTLLNEIAEGISDLTDNEKKLLCAVLEREYHSLYQMQGILDSLGEYHLCPNVTDHEELGNYYIHELEHHDLDKMGELANYLDYEAYGRDIDFNSSGGFTSHGWLERR